MPKRTPPLLAGLLVALSICAMPAAHAAPNAVIAGYGQTHTANGAAERPDAALRYRVLFNITEANAGESSGKANESLAKVARFINLLGDAGVRPQRGDVVAIVHGGATPSVMGDAAYRARHGGAANPTLELIHRLRDAGVSIRVCSQALAGHSIASDAVDAAVQVDVAALTTLANLQLRGWALIPD